MNRIYMNLFNEVNTMRIMGFVAGALILGFLLGVQASPLHAQAAGKTLSLLYSNNMNGEIDPCPT